MRAPTFSSTRANGIELAQWDWAGAEGQPSILFFHATGFHGRCWDQVIRHMDPNARATALDMRSHGRSQQIHPPMHWPDFANDVAALGDTLGWKNAIGVGHSMGGYSVALAAAMRPGMFSALVLLDPVIRAPDDYNGAWYEEHFARKRRRHWDSADEMFERFKGRGPFKAWDEQVLRDYCDYALNSEGDLACPPEVEGSIYENCTLPSANPYLLGLDRIEIPVVVVRSGIEFVPGSTVMEASPTDPRLAGLWANSRDEHWSEVSHFVPMEAPGRVARLVGDTIP
ncbi:MAG TPA: alpha/beta hydrolase [Bryobacteraceae bacterium]